MGTAPLRSYVGELTLRAQVKMRKIVAAMGMMIPHVPHLFKRHTPLLLSQILILPKAYIIILMGTSGRMWASYVYLNQLNMWITFHS